MKDVMDQLKIDILYYTHQSSSLLIVCRDCDISNNHLRKKYNTTISRVRNRLPTKIQIMIWKFINIDIFYHEGPIFGITSLQTSILLANSHKLH